MMETIKAIIFDMDGVIFDSETMYINDLIRFFKQHDIEIQVNDCIPLIGIDSKLYYEHAYTMWNGKTDFMTFKNMLVVSVDTEKKLLYIKGAVPGRRGTVVEVIQK